ncbi:hypothetical protein [Streptomyces sp. NPDC002763]|uniref:hypothetical protein n=1 Tax=Streptomyces sp. NPDC002763 TaxID=3154427 RepID=UPI00331EF560
MKEAEIPGHFDGRGRVEFSLSGLEAGQSDTITAIAFEFGYDLAATEVRSRSTMRLVFVRNDSPTARQRASGTHDRLRVGGPLLMAWAIQAPGPGQAAPQTLTAVELASKRRGLAAYETNGIRGLVALVAVLSVGCLVVAWALRHGPVAAVVLAALFAVALAVLAVLIPSLTRRWYEKNRRLVDLYDQQRAGRVGPPPPPPGPVPGSPPGGFGQGG